MAVNVSFGPERDAVNLGRELQDGDLVSPVAVLSTRSVPWRLADLNRSIWANTNFY